MTDLLLAGGGLANTLIALKLATERPELEILLLEQGAGVGGNHTWSFHGSDLPAAQLAWLAPLIVKSWQGYDIRFPKRTRTLSGTYHSIASERLAEVAQQTLGERIHTAATVTELGATYVKLADNSELTARAVIDGRGPVSSPHLDVRFQKFVGQLVQLSKPHGADRPVIMDALPEQQDGYRFMYTLPFSANTVLIEDTRYSDAPDIDAGEYAREIAAYADSRGWHIERVLRSEEGVLPITLGGDITAFWDAESPGVPRSGLRAALFHPATGYSLPDAMRLATALAAHQDLSAPALYALTRGQSESRWRATGFYRALNRMLFLAAAPTERRAVLERFYGLDEKLIARFYAGSSTLGDKLRILAGKPPVPPARAFDAVFRYPQSAA